MKSRESAPSVTWVCEKCDHEQEVTGVVACGACGERPSPRFQKGIEWGLYVENGKQQGRDLTGDVIK